MKRNTKILLSLLLSFNMLVGCTKNNPTTKDDQPKTELVEKEEEKKEEEIQEEKEEVKEEEKIEVKEEVKEEIKEEVKQETVQPAPQPTPQPAPTPTPAPSVPPIVAPTPPQSNGSHVVVIDAGHGGNDPGCSYGSYIEKNITLDYALKIGSILQSKGITVVYTRTGDTTLQKDTYRMQDGSTRTNDLRARAEYGEQFNAEYYISIHVDSYNETAKGFSIFAHSAYADSLDLASYVSKEMANLNYTNNRGIKDGQHLRSIRCNTTIPILVEIGFIIGDLPYITGADSKNALCNAIATGIINKVNAGKKEPNLILQKQPDLY